MAGAPKDKGSGSILKHGKLVKENDIVLTIFAEELHELPRAEDILNVESPFGIGERKCTFAG